MGDRDDKKRRARQTSWTIFRPCIRARRKSGKMASYPASREIPEVQALEQPARWSWRCAVQPRTKVLGRVRLVCSIRCSVAVPYAASTAPKQADELRELLQARKVAGNEAPEDDGPTVPRRFEWLVGSSAIETTSPSPAGAGIASTERTPVYEEARGAAVVRAVKGLRTGRPSHGAITMRMSLRCHTRLSCLSGGFKRVDSVSPHPKWWGL